MAEEAERIVREAGFTGARVRVHGELVRLEVMREQFERFAVFETRMAISVALKELGYRYITIDAEGYRSGSMNKTTKA